MCAVEVGGINGGAKIMKDYDMHKLHVDFCR